MAVQHQYKVPNAPVRDDESLAADEDLDREPDGVPHDVVGYTALFSVFLAMLCAFMLLTGKAVVQAAAVAILIVAIPLLVSQLGKKSDRDRDHVHPSR